MNPASANGQNGKAADTSPFRRGTPLRAHACRACGHITLSLAR